MAERDTTSHRFANWRIVPDPEEGRVVIHRGQGRTALASLTAESARQLADVLTLAARELERAA